MVRSQQKVAFMQTISRPQQTNYMVLHGGKSINRTYLPISGSLKAIGSKIPYAH